MTDFADATRRRDRIGIVGAIVCTGIFALTIGLTFPLLAFVLEAQGYDETAIGLNAAMTPLGIMAASPLVPWATKRLAAWQVAVFCLLASGIFLLLLGLTKSYGAFLLLRFLLGISDCGVFVVSETWINQLADRRSRGRVIGIYATALSAGFAAGPLILSVIGIEGFVPFGIAGVLCAASILVVLTIRKATPDVTREKSASPWIFLRLAPTLLLAIGAFAFWESAMLSLFPLFGLDHGLTAAAITFAIAVCVLGNTVFQIPIGWIADMSSRRSVLIACAAVGVLSAALLPALINGALPLYILLAVWGATAGGLYTMAMAELGDRFSGARLVAGNAAFAVAYGLGGMIGAPITGGAMDLIGAEAFAWTLTALFAITGAYAFWRRRAHRQSASQKDGNPPPPLHR
ncbi:MAG TPA: MFS transporter [Kiloniellaceae bacterium]|nr:MFS transporter [Kiloniellaceae bacterium]